MSLSFQKNQKIHTKISDKILTRDVQFLNPKKYESYTEGNFKFITLWTVFKNNTGKIDTLKLINSYMKEDLDDIMLEKNKILLYKNTFSNDEKFMQTKIVDKDFILKSYQKGDISCLYVWWYFHNHNHEQTRIQKRQIDRINFFMTFFGKIQEYLETK